MAKKKLSERNLITQGLLYKPFLQTIVWNKLQQDYFKWSKPLCETNYNKYFF